MLRKYNTEEYPSISCFHEDLRYARAEKNRKFSGGYDNLSRKDWEVWREYLREGEKRTSMDEWWVRDYRLEERRYDIKFFIQCRRPSPEIYEKIKDKEEELFELDNIMNTPYTQVVHILWDIRA